MWTCPPAEIVAVREDASALGETEYSIDPLSPVPEDPEVIASHEALETASQPQVVPLVESVNELLPPLAEKDAAVEEKAVTAQAAPS